MKIAAKYLCVGDGTEPLSNAFVEVAEDGTVLSIGPADGSEEAFYDGMIVPGFVNSHCHLELSHLQGKFKKGTGMAGFIDQINSLRDSEPREEKIRIAQRWLDSLWSQGVSAMADISNCGDTFQMKAASPLYTRTFLEVFGTEPSECEDIIKEVSQLKAEAESCGIDAAPTPHACYTMSPELVSAASAEGLKAGFLSYHSQESHEEEELMISGTGNLADNYKGRGMRTPPVTGKPALLYFLDRLMKVHQPPFHEHILLVHNVCLGEESVNAAKEVLKNVYWAICPMSNIFIHNALPPLDLMRREGLKITLGTDSLSSNDNLDMVREMYCIQENFPHIPIGEVLSWACANGAEFLGKEELGRLEPGMKPGIVIISGIGADGRLTAGSSSKRLI